MTKKRIRKHLCFALSLIMLFSMVATISLPVTAAESQDNNIVNNGDMENSYWWYNSGNCSVTYSTYEKHSGVSSLKVAGRTSSWEGPGQNLVGNQKGGPIAGQTYHGSAWVMYKGDTAPDTVTFSLSIRRTNGSNTMYDNIKQLTVQKGVWTKLEGDYKIPDDTIVDKDFHIYVQTAETTSPMVDFYLDDVSLSPMQVSYVDIVNNGNIENSTYWWYNSGDCSIASSDEKHGGSHSLKVTGRTAAWQGPGQNLFGNQKDGPVAGKTYHGTAWVMFNADTAPDKVTFGFSLKRNDGTDDKYDSIKWLDVEKGVWTKLEGDYTLPEDTVVSKGVHLYMQTAESASPMVDFYLDDVSFSYAVTDTPSPSVSPSPSVVPSVKPDKICALTFDDGPDAVLTPKVLDKIEKYNVPATFMQVGSKINDSTKAVEDRIIADGCEIGNHSWTYDGMDKMTTEQIQKSVTDTTYAIQKYTGTTPSFFRPPNLATSSTMFDAIDLTFVSGITANDWDQTTTAQQRADAIINGVTDGSIILLHDVQPLPHPTPEALDIIIPTLLSQGYEFVTLSELFSRKGVELSLTDKNMYVTVTAKAPATGKDIVNNGDMENSTNWWFARGGCTIESASDEKHGGNSSLKVTGRTSSWEGPGQNLVGNQKGDPVAGKSYHGTAWVMYKGDTAPDSVTFKLSAQWNDGSSDKWDNIGQANVTKGEWTKIEGNYVIPATAAFDKGIQLYIETNESAAPMVDFYTDDISLVDPQGGSVSLNGSDSLYSDFENGNSDGWASRGNETVAVTKDVYHNGSYGISVTDRTYGWNGPKHTLMGVVNFEKSYHISGYVMYKDGPDTQDFKLSVQKTVDGSTTYTNIGSITAVKGKWALVEGDLNVAYEPTLSDIAVYFETPGNAADPLTNFYIDDIKVAGGDSLDYDPNITALRSVWDKYFPMGVAVSPEILQSPIYSAYIKKHYASLTADNCMKPESIEPTEGQFDFTNADKIVDFAKANNMLMRGHTLLWHSQMPTWYFNDPADSTIPATSEMLLGRLKTYIETVMTHFNGKIHTYDVVNEVLSDSNGLRGTSENSKWKSIVGDVDKDGIDDDYIIAAFQYAYETANKIGDNNVKFCINDYNLESSTNKVDAMYNLVSRILSKTGIPKDRLVVGFQMHISSYSPSIVQIRRAMEKIASLGVKTQVTEMDMSIYQSSSEPKKTPTQNDLLLQAKRYKDVFALFKDEAQKGNLDTVTLWGVDDGNSWLNDFPVKGRTDASLLFNKRLQAKPAYTALVDPDSLPVYVQSMNAYKGTPSMETNIDTVWGTIKATEANQFVKGSEGATAKIKTMWDSQYLYVLAQVDDTTPNSKDNIEIFLDKDIYDSQDSIRYVDHYTVFSNDVGSSNIKHYVKSESGSYTVQAAIPIEDVRPEPGRHVSIDFRINDYAVNGTSNSIVVWNDEKNQLDTQNAGLGELVLDKEVKLVKSNYGTPSIDGNVDPVWNNVQADETNVWVQGTTGSTAKFKTLWDENNLYILADVTDSLLSKASSDAYQQDSIEIFIDQDNAKNPYYEADDYQIRVNYANEVSFDHGNIEGFKSATKTTETGYIVEAVVPLTAVKAEAGKILGFDLQVNNDQDGDGTRDSVSIWCDPSGSSYKDVSGLGNLMLMDKMFSVSGYVSPEYLFGTSALAGFKVEVEGTGLTAVTNEEGYFEIKNVPQSTKGYTVKISKAGFLARELKNVFVTGNVQIGASNSPVSMWIGDLAENGVQDNAINMADVMILASAFNSKTGDSRYSPDLDLDKDGAVNLMDIMVMTKHFNKASTNYPNLNLTIYLAN